MQEELKQSRIVYAFDLFEPGKLLQGAPEVADLVDDIRAMWRTMGQSSNSTFRPISQPPHSDGKRFGGLRAAIPPDQVPSPVDSALADQRIWSSEPFLTCDTERTVPLAGSDYNAVDQGEYFCNYLWHSISSL